MGDQATPYVKLLNQSGFPFQAAVESALRRVGLSPQSEIPWAASDGAGGFVDLVVTTPSPSPLATLCFFIECKKVSSEDWLFVHAQREKQHGGTSRFEYHSKRSKAGRNGETPVFCANWYHDPGDSPEVDMCVSPKGAGNPGMQLENLSRQLLAAGRALLGDATWKRSFEMSVLVPVLVTNAGLLHCELDATKVDLETGSIPDAAVSVQRSSYVRFRKTLATYPSNNYQPEPMEAKAWAEDRQRTIFVTTPDGLKDVLNGFRIFAHAGSAQPPEFQSPPLAV